MFFPYVGIGEAVSILFTWRNHFYWETSVGEAWAVLPSRELRSSGEPFSLQIDFLKYWWIIVLAHG